MTRRSRLAATLMRLFIVAASFAVLAALPARSDPVDDYVDAERARQQIPGLSIAVVRDATLVKAAGYGLANIELNVPATEHTIFQSGSVGKQFTAALVMSLVEEGKLALDDRLVDHVQGAPPAWRDITVRHLLTHTSGLSNAVYEKIDLRRDYTEDELTREIAALPLDFAPGDRWSYSNSGYVMLGVLIGKVTGSFYGDLLRQKIFEPAGMTTARVISEADIVPNRAAGYRLVDGEIKNQEWVSPSLNTTADGALYVTALDMAKWETALAKGNLLEPESLRLMWTPVTLNDGSPTDYGFGWQVTELRRHRVIQHGGRWQGFGSHIARYVDSGLTVVVLTNLAEANPARIALGIAGLYEPELAPVKHTVISVAPDRLERYAGEYEFAPGETLTITREGGGLAAQPGGGRKLPILPFAETEFFAEGAEVEFEFLEEAGVVTALVLRPPGGGSAEAKKIK
jgi:CubicO group peptidase (beta-lactamase class C family)